MDLHLFLQTHDLENLQQVPIFRLHFLLNHIEPTIPCIIPDILDTLLPRILRSSFFSIPFPLSPIRTDSFHPPHDEVQPLRRQRPNDDQA